jgi:hypothetical protein
VSEGGGEREGGMRWHSEIESRIDRRNAKAVNEVLITNLASGYNHKYKL